MGALCTRATCLLHDRTIHTRAVHQVAMRLGTMLRLHRPAVLHVEYRHARLLKACCDVLYRRLTSEKGTRSQMGQVAAEVLARNAHPW